MVNKSTNSGASNGKPAADFPKHGLKAALRVPQAIEDQNGGNPMPPTDVAIALAKSPGSSDFRVLLSSSIKYGLTNGSYNQEKISLADLGTSIVAPVSEEQKRKAIFEAALGPEVFRKVFDAYKGKKVPEVQFFQNAVVREFGVSKDQAERFVAIFLENAEFLGLVKQASTGKWFGQSPDFPQVHPAEVDEAEEVATLPESDPAPARRQSTSGGSKNAIFVGHGKNKIPRNQLEKILSEYKIPHKVAVDEPNRGRPISKKVADTMNECGAAIVIFTADEELKRPSDETIYRPSENAVFELGAASVMYGSRLIIFKEAGVDFPSNFRDIGYIEFEHDKLSDKASDLLRELIGLNILTFNVAQSV